MFRKIFSSLVLTAVFTVTAVAAPWVNMKITYNYNTYDYSAEAVYVIVNGKQLNNLPMEPIILDGTTLVPAREICEAFGAVVDWKKETEEIFIAHGNSIVVLKVNSKEANVNGTSANLSVPARIINNKTMIPVRFVSEAFDMQVDWLNVERTIYIKEKSVDTPLQETTMQGNSESVTQVTTENISEQGNQQIVNSFNQNILFDFVNKTLVLKNSNADFNSQDNSITYSNNDKTVNVLFNSSIGTAIQAGLYDVNDSGLSNILYSDNGKTQITFNCDKKLNLKIESDKTYVYITLKG